MKRNFEKKREKGGEIEGYKGKRKVVCGRAKS